MFLMDPKSLELLKLNVVNWMNNWIKCNNSMKVSYSVVHIAINLDYDYF